MTDVSYRLESLNSMKDDPTNSSLDLSSIFLPILIPAIFGGVYLTHSQV